MNRQRMVRKKQLTFMFLNLIAFTVIFTIFGLIIFGQVQTTLISETDKELLAFQRMITDDNQREVSPPAYKEGRFAPRTADDRTRMMPNPRIIVLDWNENGEIMNEDQIGTLIYENYLLDYTLDPKTLDEITSVTMEESFHFRSLLFESAKDGIAYTQLLINIDAEHTVLNNFGKLLILCSFVFVILSISASYLLSKKMMKPIIQSWDKQAEFVENASHELRTPLTIIQNKLELLLAEPQEKIINRFENIALSLSETRRLSKLTSDLLTLARADSAETELAKKPMAVDEFVKRVWEPYREIAESQDKHVWLHLNSNQTIEADEIRLHQLLVILLDNAIKYTSTHDSIGVKTYVDNQKAVIEVTDTGIGIQEENIKHVFDRFYREDCARSRETGGTGLGLSIAQWIVTSHGGTISVSRNEQNGTTFKVKLPK
ncbi:sensor histidine kinase [Halalkalibacterium halodurans]|uniref:sensor histidine kinase n=1 Tax=Halalkalibacterium halodurans TaxID=86665 RepID=UPI002AAA1132|nr:ATP-binding protein [Halalkalibacterium halodurans]MDY7224452.1 ATP-binding protein [Halalkalibacterium halodurans]MDY7243737.1 ATP-binding protein [Halalkalibacterium halodurans]